MPAITLGFPEIEGQLRNIRRRRNALTLQQALYLSGGGFLLIAALLVVLALRTSPTVFTLGLWGGLVVIAVLTMGGARYVWRNWLSAHRTVRWADETAQLEDRLATLVAHQRQPQPSRLTGLVVTQLITLRHRWQPVVLVPRRIPRSVYFFCAALLLLAVTALLERRDPPATPPTVQAMRGSEQGPKAHHRAMQASHSGQSGSGDSHDGSGEEWDVVDHAAGDAQGAAATASSRKAASNPSARGSRQRLNLPASGLRSVPQPGKAATGTSRSGETAGNNDSEGETTQEQVAERVQAMIRTALGAQPVGSEPRTGQMQSGNKPDLRHPDDRAAQPGSAGSERGNETGNARTGEHKRDIDGAAQRRDARTAQREQHDGDPQQGGARASGAMPGAGTGAGSPLGSPPAPSGERTLTRTFQLKLSALAVSLRSLTEPQAAPPGSASMPHTGAAPEGLLTDRDREDDTLVRTDIAPEHEAIVKRIFSHDQE